MDIQNASNLERLLFFLCQDDPDTVRCMLQHYAKHGALDWDTTTRARALAKAREVFSTARASDGEIGAAQAVSASVFGYHMCPHTAAGFHALLQSGGGSDSPLELGYDCTIVMATAHPAKFGTVLAQMTSAEGRGWIPSLPTQLRGLWDAPTRCAATANRKQNMLALMRAHADRRHMQVTGRMAAVMDSCDGMPDMGGSAAKCVKPAIQPTAVVVAGTLACAVGALVALYGRR